MAEVSDVVTEPPDLSKIEGLIPRINEAWVASKDGDVGAALRAYTIADAMMPEGMALNAALSLLRHNLGRPEGIVTAVPPTEDTVITFNLTEGITIESKDNVGMRMTTLDRGDIEHGIRHFLHTYQPAYPHEANISENMPHVLVMSTGRCGTVSLSKLLQRSKAILAYHTYWWSTYPTARWEMMCRLLACEPRRRLADSWIETRAAEWLGAMGNDTPMVGLNHYDTIFAPVFMKLHPMSKFVHLRRHPLDVFDSFYRKNQWREAQLRPMEFSLIPEFRFRRTADSLPVAIAWYIRFTEEFSRAVGRIVGERRFIEIKSDDLFSGDLEAALELIEFVGAKDIALDDAIAHFGTRINAKDHKVNVEEDDMAGPRNEFIAAYQALGG